MVRPTAIVILSICAFFFQNVAVSAFDGTDVSPPRIASMKSLSSPTKENDWKISILIVTEDDKNWVLKPKMTLQIAFPWVRLTQAPPPKCQSIARMSIPLDILEVDQLRVKRQGASTQTFVAFGTIPMLARPVENCVEIRDFLAKPIVALNGRGIVTSVRKGEIAPTYSGGLFEPSLEDESGRTSPGNLPAKDVRESDIAPREWPQVPRFLCFSQRELGILVDRLPLFSQLADEMNRSIELGNELDLSPDRKVASLKSLVLEYADLSRTFDSTFNSLRLCDSPYTSSQVTGMVQTSISRIKKSNDEFVRQIAALNREQEKANRDKVISKQNSMLSEKDSLLKSLTSQFSAFALDYERITKTQTRQTSGISFGSKVDQKRANADLEKKRTENQSAISQYRARMNELDKEMGLTEAEKNATPDKSLKSFLDKYLKKLEQIRSMIFKILMTLLNFDKYYLGRLS